MSGFVQRPERRGRWSWNARCSSIRPIHPLSRRSRRAARWSSAGCAPASISCRAWSRYYWWQGAVERGEEVVMIIKTRAGLAEAGACRGEGDALLHHAGDPRHPGRIGRSGLSRVDRQRGARRAMRACAGANPRGRAGHCLVNATVHGRPPWRVPVPFAPFNRPAMDNRKTSQPPRFRRRGATKAQCLWQKSPAYRPARPCR